MGMFNYIDCQAELPDNPANKNFQTKDIGDLLMDTYTITSDGYLLDTDKEPMDFHGKIKFYTSSGASCWFEYEAKFTDGKLVEIKRIPGNERQS